MFVHLRGICRSMVLLQCLSGWLAGAALNDGRLTITLPTTPVVAGTTLEVVIGFSERGDRNKQQRDLKGRSCTFFALPMRFALDAPPPLAIPAHRLAADRYRLDLAGMRPDWWIISVRASATAADDPGAIKVDGEGNAEGNAKDNAEPDERDQAMLELGNKDPLQAWAVVGLRDPVGAAIIRVHTERARTVFCPGEEVRVWVSGRAAKDFTSTVQVQLLPGAGGTGLPLGTLALRGVAGGETSAALDLPAAFTAAIPPGRHDLVLSVQNQEIDRLPLRWVAAAPASAKARWWHGQPFGNSSGLDPAPAAPANLAAYARWIDGEAKAVHGANLWVQLFADGNPLLPMAIALPQADAVGMPPLASAQRPAATQALYQMLLARGIALGVMLGGSELGSENYNPLPTIDQDQIDVVARRYVAGSLSLAQNPNFVGVYTDAYGRPEWHGEGGKKEVAPEQVEAARKAMYEAACGAAGVRPAPPPPFEFGDEKNPLQTDHAMQEPKLNGDQRKAFATAAAGIITRDHGGDPAALHRAPQAVRLAAWQAAWASAGIRPAPAARVNYPLPTPNGVDLAAGGPEASYRYIEFVQQGITRSYAAATTAIERVLPGVFTIHNHNRENHRQPFVYAWRDWSRSPSMPGEYADGCTVVASSEWNLDAEPQSYLLSAEVLRPLIARGRAVWRTAAFSWNGAQTRFLRDAVFLSGRGITPFFHTPSTATWGQRGADQSTYAAKDRLAAVSEFLTAYEGFFAEQDPVREVAYYLRPGWGDENVLSMVTAFPSALMTGWQTQVVSHSQLREGGLQGFSAVLALGLPEPLQYPFEQEAFRAFIKQGGKVFGSPAGNGRYESFIKLGDFGIRRETYQEVDGAGRPRQDKQGNPVLGERWVDTPAARARATAAAIWPQFPQVTVLPIDFTQLFARTEADGSLFSYGRRAHWTGFHNWANTAGAALAYHTPLGEALAAVGEPLVRCSEPEVFVAAMRPRAGAKGLTLFAANYTIPKDPAWTSTRVPWFFWPTYAQPVTATISVKAAGIGALYDLMNGGQVATTRAGDRVEFIADMTDIEGRVYVAFPEAVASAAVYLPSGAITAGAPLHAQFVLRGSSGQDLGVLGAVRVRLLSTDGKVMAEQYRALRADGALPALHPPAGASVLEVVDTIAGFSVRVPVQAVAPTATPQVAKPVTIARGDLVHAVLQQPGLRVVVVDVAVSFDKNGDVVRGEINSDLTRDRQAAESIVLALKTVGVTATVVELSAAVQGPLYAHPWTGPGGVYRSRHTVPDLRLDGPVIVVGSWPRNPLLEQIEQAGISPRSLADGNGGPGRALIAALPEAFAPRQDAILIAAGDVAGFALAAPVLAGLQRTNPGLDSFHAAREAVRWQFVPVDVRQVKAAAGISPVVDPAPTAMAAAIPATAKVFRGFAARLAPHVFTIQASAGGVVAGLSTLDRPLAVLNPSGVLVGRFGHGDQVMPRDVAIAADGSAIAGGFSLIGRIAGWKLTASAPLWTAQGGIVHKDDPLAWDTYKDSERFLVASPDRQTVFVAAGNAGVQARDLRTGTVRWTLPTTATPELPLGPALPEMAVSPEGDWLLAYQQQAGPDGKGAVALQAVLVETKTGRPRWTGPVDAAGWELYASVGARGAWIIASTRDGSFSIRDDQGTTLRIVQGAELPGSLARQRGMNPVQVAMGADPKLVVLGKAEATTLAVMDLEFGAPALRAQARTAITTSAATVAAVRAELSDKNNVKKWQNEYVDSFLATIDAPAEALALLGAKMKRFDAEARAGRKRDFRWISDEFTTFTRLVEERDRVLIDSACQLRVSRTIELPALVNDFVVDAQPNRVFVATWDGWVRCYALSDGALVWAREVGPGCRLALVGDVLYAGSSRGQISRLQTADGVIAWTTSVLDK